MTEPTIDVDDLSETQTRELLRLHLEDMHAITPAESVHALDLSALQHPDVVFWSARAGDRVAGIAAMKRLDGGRGELKSMRVADEWRGTGVGRMLLRHAIAHAREAGLTSLWLETGSTAEFEPARRLYLSEGFVETAAFSPYSEDPLSTFMTLPL